MKSDELTISNGNIFLISDNTGEICGEKFQGLYCADVRHINSYQMFINGLPLDVLTSQTIDFESAAIVLTNRSSAELSQFDLSIVRKRNITRVYYEEIEVTNHSDKQVTFVLKLTFGADFRDIFAIRSLAQTIDNEKRHIKILIRRKQQQLVFSYEREAYRRSTVIQFSKPVVFEKKSCVIPITLKPEEKYSVSLSIAFLFGKKSIESTKISKIYRQSQTLRTWQWANFNIDTDWDDLEFACKKSLKDLAALRIHEEEAGGKSISLPAAGIPWFVAVFGRDSLITAYQSVILSTELAKGILYVLARYQGKEENLLKNEEPGKILHEMRFGEAAFFRDWVSFPYYGTVDATPLFLILLSTAYRFGVPDSFIKSMKEPALAALSWIDSFGDLDGDGFLEYIKTTERGLDNQNWRDSWDSMVFSDGTIAQPPIASTDVQGYVYDAKLRIAEIARNVWKDTALAQRLEQEAAALKKKFNEVFWIQDKGYFALGLDKDKKQIDSLSSCIGQLLWSGIVDDDKIEPTCNSLFSDALYSGWGVRTISKKDNGYNPIIYHRGTVWPHDNSLIAAGLYKVGKRDLALRIMQDMLAASANFDYRLPEVFAGFSKEETPFPVEYPTACSPQAWAAATPILFLSLLLGLEPDIKKKTLRINPYLPDHVEYLHVDGISAFGKTYSVDINKKRSIIYQQE